MKFHFITIFPEMVEHCLAEGVVGKAVARGLVECSFWNPRDYTHDRHRTVDDRPFGGGPGMVMKAEPLYQAVTAARQAAPGAPVWYMSPQGQRFDQEAARAAVELPGVVLLAGRYEGVDERLLETAVDAEWSIGDYVLSGGELPALVIMDAIVRLLPGTLGHEDSAREDSFEGGLLDCPHYTRPEVWREMAAPEVLLSGNHARIAEWRKVQSMERTRRRRPDLIEKQDQ